MRFFYAPDVASCNELPQEEAAHAVRVLRLQAGDELMLMDGVGSFWRADITVATHKHCFFVVKEKIPQPRLWNGCLRLAVAPTKNMDRMEWLAEKATEIGLDALTFLNCDFSERKVLKSERIDKILVSAMKQSHKAWKPELTEIISFAAFVKQDFKGQKFIAHCYNDTELMPEGKPFLLDVLNAGDALVLIGPEGDFSANEVRMALQYGFQPISLGESRLRTETAALVAVHLMNLKNRLR
ncbi:MAG: 16S rRNA (uracil(1498)-N(3))-methyltransferase [Bacteroidaceae bacterium]